MEEIRELAKKLAKMGIYNATFEADIQRIMDYKEQVNKAFSASSMIYDSKSRSGVTPGFSIQIHGVKLYFNDPKTYIEKA